MLKDLIRLDGWRNLLTGLGVKGKDKRMDFNAQWQPMNQYEAENLYASDEMATKIVDYPVEEMFRAGLKFTHPNADEKFDEDMQSLFKEYSMFQKIIQAMKYARLFGSGYLVFGGLDDQEPGEEIELEKIKGYKWCQVLHRWDLTPHDIQRDVTKKNWKEPKTYMIDAENTDYPQIHRTRLIIFNGAFLPEHLYEINNYSHDSVLNKVQDSIRNFNMAHDSAATTLQEFSMGIYKMKDLAKLIGSGKESQVITRLGLIDAKKSMVRSIVLDKEEEYKRETVNLGGVPDILDRVGNRLVADTNMPHTIVLGEGATGSMGGDGKSERKDWHEFVKRKQMTELKPALIHAAVILLKASGGKVPEGLDVEFNPLWESSDTEKADIRLKTSQADKLDIENQVLDPDEVALSRYGSGKYSLDTKIDPKLREENISTGEEGTGEEADLENLEQ